MPSVPPNLPNRPSRGTLAAIATGTMILVAGCATTTTHTMSISAYSQVAINAEADRRLAEFKALSDSEQALQWESQLDALTAVTAAQMQLILAEVNGTSAEQERMLRAIESYAGPRASWPHEILTP